MRQYSRADTRFADRSAAGKALADRLKSYAHRNDVLVLGLPRGGVPVAAEVARALDAELDVFVVRKLGLPHHPELAMGALASGGIRVLNESVIEWYGVTNEAIEAVARTEQHELERREQAYRQGRPVPRIADKIVVLVDDGLATGSTMQAAVAAVRQQRPARVIVAVPVGARETCNELAETADEVVCVSMPAPFIAVGLWYEDFSPTSDADVQKVLQANRAERLPMGARR